MKKNNRQGFKESLRKTFFRYALLPIMCLLVIWSVGISIYSVVIVKYNNVHLNNRISHSLSEQCREYKDMLQNASNEEVLIQALENPAQITKANQFLYDFNNRQLIRSMFYMFDTDGNLISSNVWGDREEYKIGNHFKDTALENIKRLPDEKIYQSAVRRHTTGNRNTVYTMAKPLKSEGSIVGYLVFDFLEEDFFQFVTSREVSYIVVTDKLGNSIYSTDSTIIGPISKFIPNVEGSGVTKIGGSSVYLYEGIVPGCSLQVYTLSLLAAWKQIMFFGLILIALSAVLIMVMMQRLSGRVANKNTEHLEGLLQAVDELRKGDYRGKTISGSDSEDEFTYLTEQYQALIDRICELIEQNKELADATRQAQIKHLQAQFNPHFIFNVLDTLKYVVYIDKNQAVRIIDLLARLLRYSISDEEEMVTLEHDMTYIRNYLALQKIRYDERLVYHIFIPEDLMKYCLPKLIIQPLVENCIVHGYHRKETLAITIIGEKRDGDIVLRITDDGDGINEEKLEELRQRLKHHREDESSIGLCNSNRRLQLIYGLEYQIHVNSIPEVGTEVEVRIPANPYKPKGKEEENAQGIIGRR